jgi:hypothetical protein
MQVKNKKASLYLAKPLNFLEPAKGVEAFAIQTQ